MARPFREDEESAAIRDAQDAVQDALLVGRVLRGDADAYGVLVSRHMRRAFAVAYRILEHREDAEDVVQDALIRALERLDQLDRSRPFRPWLLRIVVNVALNHRRARGIRATRPIPDATAAGDALPDRAAEDAELRARLQDALDALPERQRTIVQLVDLEGLTSAEVGDVVELSPGTVRWHLYQARKTLRAALASMMEDT